MPWLREGCQDRLAGSASMDGFVAQRSVIASCWYELWLREGCQDRLACSASMDALHTGCPKHVEQLLEEK